MELRHEIYTAHCSGWQWKVAELVSISAYLLIQPPPLGIAPASVPSPQYRFSTKSQLTLIPHHKGGTVAAPHTGHQKRANGTKNSAPHTPRLPGFTSEQSGTGSCWPCERATAHSRRRLPL